MFIKSSPLLMQLLIFLLQIEAKLQNIKQVQTWETFVESMKAVAKDIRDVSETAIARQRELKNSTAKQLLVAAHAELTQQSKMLITSTKVRKAFQMSCTRVNTCIVHDVYGWFTC